MTKQSDGGLLQSSKGVMQDMLNERWLTSMFEILIRVGIEPLTLSSDTTTVVMEAIKSTCSRFLDMEAEFRSLNSDSKRVKHTMVLRFKCM